MTSYDQELIEQGKCADLVWVLTEDGPVTGRCQAPIVTVVISPDPRWGETEPQEAAFACEGHSAERLGWLAMSEIEKADYERREEGLL